MDRIDIADATARLSELVQRVEAGESVEIIRDGKLAARLVPPLPPKRKVDVEALRRFTEGQPMQDVPAGDFIRQMRDSARY